MGEEDEISFWGPGRILCYWRDPERAAMTIDQDGWCHTGDLGRCDDQSYLPATGRLKDIIIRSGPTSARPGPRATSLRIPAVAQVAEVACYDERVGEKASAIVVAKPASTWRWRTSPASYGAETSPGSSCPRSSCSSTTCR
jgi:cyclohexanecarboxylate-CoA ligase/acyl-CoA synthetase